MARQNETPVRPAQSRGLAWATLALIVAVGMALYMRPEPLAPLRTPDAATAEQAQEIQDPADTAERFGQSTERQSDADPSTGTAAIETPGAAVTDSQAEETTAPAEALSEERSSEVAAAASVDAPGSPQVAEAVRLRPTIDEVRLEADGVLVVAGRAAPGDEVGLLVDGQEIGGGRADGSGAFAAIAMLDQTERARVLTLRARGASGEVASLDEVILAPRQTAQPPGTALAGAEEAGGAAATVAAASATEPAAPGVGASDPAAADAVAAVAAPEDAAASAGRGDASEPSTTAAEAGGEIPQVAILRSTEEGVSLVQPALPDAAAVALDTIGYADDGSVQLSGRATRADSEVRIYLDNRPVAQLPLDENGNWRGEVPDISTGVYTLRVDAVNAAGDVTSRVETPFKRESPDVLAEAAQGLSGPVRAVTVQTGDTLWAIARDRYGEGVLYVRVFEANRASIRDPDLIYPGQVFDLPPG